MTEQDSQFGRGRLNAYVDIESLVEEIGLDEDEIAWRKDFIGFDQTDARHLERFSGPVDAHADEIVDSFYDHLTSYDETQAVIDRSPKSIDQLKQTQKAYLRSLTGGEYDDAYFRNRARIGKLHELLDMPMKHYIGQYNVYYSLLLGLMTDRIHDRLADTVMAELSQADVDIDADGLTRRLYADVEASIDELHSLLKILNLDMQVAVDTYLQSRIDEIELERDRFAALFENVPTPVVVVRIDDGLRVEQVNAAFEELFGYTAADLADKDFERYLTPTDEEPRPIEDRGIVNNVHADTESELSEAEVTLETQFGRREFIRVSAPVNRPDTDDLEYAFYIDVTDQKQRQERLQVLSRILRHDLRNKMNIVKGSAESLTEAVDEESRQAMLDRIERSSEELLATSEEIRRVERFVAGEADRRAIHIVERVEHALESVQERHTDCDFAVNAADDLRVNASETIDLALEEVIENGAEHNDADEPHVEVSVAESLDGQYVDIRVADNGPGIPPAEYEVLTGERDRSQTDHLSGLGLWTVNWIITRIGGTLQFSANSPRGSIVTLSLPKATSSDES